MPKIKVKNNGFNAEDKERIDKNLEYEKQFMFITGLKLYPFILISAVFALLLNMKVLTVPDFASVTTMKIINILLKSILILVFFFLTIVATANIIELRGNIMTWKEMLIIIILTLVQSVFDYWVLLVVAIGIIIIMTYIYLIQSQVEDRLDYKKLAET